MWMYIWIQSPGDRRNLAVSGRLACSLSAAASHFSKNFGCQLALDPALHTMWVFSVTLLFFYLIQINGFALGAGALCLFHLYLYRRIICTYLWELVYQDERRSLDSRERGHDQDLNTTQSQILAYLSTTQSLQQEKEDSILKILWGFPCSSIQCMKL